MGFNLFYTAKLYVDGENVDLHTIKGCKINLSEVFES